MGYQEELSEQGSKFKREAPRVLAESVTKTPKAKKKWKRKGYGRQMRQIGRETR